MSVSKSTRKVISRYPFIRESLRSGMINYRALAREILPEVSEICGRNVTIEAIVTATRRYREELPQRSREDEISKILADAKVSMRGNVGVVTIGGSWGAEKVKKVGEKISDVEPLQVIQGRRLTTIVADLGDIDGIADGFGGNVREIKKGLSIVSVISPEEITKVPGVIASMAQRLLGEDINIVEMMSCSTDTIFILRRGDAVSALRAMEELIENSKRKLQ